MDGSPMEDIPSLLKFIDEHGVTHFGTSPRWLSELKSREVVPRRHGLYRALRNVTSTGSVLVSDLYHHFYTIFPSHVQLASISGGTDLMSCFFLHNQVSPVIAGQLQCTALGMDVQVYDLDGKAIKSYGTPGELICKRAFPSQPIYFLSDPDGAKYKSAYYERYPGVWHHSDFVQWESTGGITMLGRSDGVLNPSGVRFGSAEIYSVIARFPEIEDSVCVGQRRPTDKDESVVLFIKTVQDNQYTAALVDRIKRAIRDELSSRHGKHAHITYQSNAKGKSRNMLFKSLVYRLRSMERKSSLQSNR